METKSEMAWVDVFVTYGDWSWIRMVKAAQDRDLRTVEKMLNRLFPGA